MIRLVNRAKMTTSTTGTGALALGSAMQGFQTFADAGVQDGDEVRYVIEEGVAWEIGTGVYSSSGPSLTRVPSESSAGGGPIDLQGQAFVYVSASAADVYRANSINRYSFTATENQTAFSGSDDQGSTLSYTPDFIIVSLNGVTLVEDVDYSATDGARVVLTVAAEIGDTLSVIAFNVITGVTGPTGENVTITVVADQAAFDAATPSATELVVLYA